MLAAVMMMMKIVIMAVIGLAGGWWLVSGDWRGGIEGEGRERGR